MKKLIFVVMLNVFASACGGSGSGRSSGSGGGGNSPSGPGQPEVGGQLDSCIERVTGFGKQPPAGGVVAVAAFARAARECGSGERDLAAYGRAIASKYPGLKLSGE